MKKIEALTEAELVLKQSVLNLISLEKDFMENGNGMMLGAQTHEMEILANDSIILKNASEVLNYLRINLDVEEQ